MTQLIVYSENEFDQFPCGWLKGNLFYIKTAHIKTLIQSDPLIVSLSRRILLTSKPHEQQERNLYNPFVLESVHGTQRA